MNTYFAGLCLFNVPAKLGLVTQIYGMTGVITIIHLILYAINRNITSNTTLNIEWDMETEEFVVKLPRNTMGGIVEKRVTPANFQMVRDDPSCVYFDAKTGQKFRTVDRGMWYNNGLLYFIFQNKF